MNLIIYIYQKKIKNFDIKTIRVRLRTTNNSCAIKKRLIVSHLECPKKYVQDIMPGANDTYANFNKSAIVSGCTISINQTSKVRWPHLTWR